MGVRSRRGVWVLGLALAAACGGHARIDPASGSPGTAGSNAVASAGNVSTNAGGSASGGPSLEIPPDDDASMGGTNASSSPIPVGCPGSLGTCPRFQIDLDLSRNTDSGTGVWAEPLQTQSFGMRPEGYYPPSANVDPATWDRSPMPAGACVFRLHNVPSNCVRSGTILNAVCGADVLAGGQPTAANDYYDSNRCEQGVAPGCPTADPWNASGLWWYLLPDGTETDLVMCAPQCAASVALYGDVCLTLP